MNSKLNQIMKEEEEDYEERENRNTIDGLQLQKANSLVSKVMGKKHSKALLTQDDVGPSLNQPSSSSSSRTPNWLISLLSSINSTSLTNPCDCLLHSCLSG